VVDLLRDLRLVEEHPHDGRVRGQVREQTLHATAGPKRPSGWSARPRYTSAMPPVAMRDVSRYRPNQEELVLTVNEVRSLHCRVV
jgi:hypothetical protein